MALKAAAVASHAHGCGVSLESDVGTEADTAVTHGDADAVVATGPLRGDAAAAGIGDAAGPASGKVRRRIPRSASRGLPEPRLDGRATTAGVSRRDDAGTSAPGHDASGAKGVAGCTVIAGRVTPRVVEFVPALEVAIRAAV